MANNILTTRIILCNDTSVNWGTSKKVLLKGETGFEFLDDGSVKMKLGNGVNTFAELPYATMPPGEITAAINTAIAAASHNHENKAILDAITASFTTILKNNYDTAYTHSTQAHAPSNAERNVLVGIQKNGADLTIDSAARKVNITVPTKTSELQNDSGFKTTDNNTIYNLSGAASATNGNTKIHLTGSDSTTDSVTIKGSGSVTVTSDADGAITITGTDTKYTHPNSGVTAGTYKSITVNAQGHVTGGTNPTTLAEYGITDAVKSTEKGTANGVATLGNDGKIPNSQLPSYVDDVIEGYLHGGKFYKESAHTTEIAGESGKIFVELTSGKTYRWSGSAFVVISETIALGTTSSTAGRGDWNKTAYDHSQSPHAPDNAEENQMAFSNISVGSATISADSKTDTLTFAAGNNITLTPDAANDKITIAAVNTNNAVTQTITKDTNAEYRLLFSSTADDTTRTEGARKDTDLTYNPSTNTITVGTVKGTLDGNAATANIATKAGEKWTVTTNVGEWSRVCKLTGYGSVLFTFQFNQANQVIENTCVIGVGYGTAFISQISASGYSNNSTPQIRITRGAASHTIHYVEIYNTFGYNSATIINSACQLLDIGNTNLVVTTYTAYTATDTSPIVEYTLQCCHNGVAAANFYGNLTGDTVYPNTTNTGSLGSPSNKWSTVYATTLYGDLDGTIKSTSVNPTAAITYYPAIHTINSTAQKTLYNTPYARFSILKGTADTTDADGTLGYDYLILGSDINAGADNNAYGAIRLYSTNTGFSNLRYSASATNVTHYLPAINGTIAVFNAARTSNQVVITDGTTGNIKSSGYTIATSVPSGAVFTDTKVTQTLTAASSSYPVLLAPSGQTATATTTSYFATGLTFNPGTKTLTTTTFSGALNGNAASATRLSSAKTISLSGAATGTATGFDGSANISIPVTSLNAVNLILAESDILIFYGGNASTT